MSIEKFLFIPYGKLKYEVDPVFKQSSFELYGNAGEINKPDLFEVTFNQHTYRYCLINPFSFIKDTDFISKVKKYLLVNEITNNPENNIHTYFIGDMKLAIEVAEEFRNQKTLILTKEIVEQWYPNSLDELIQIIVKVIIKKQKYVGEPFLLSSLDDEVLFTQPNLSDVEKRNYRTFLLNSMSKEGLISTINDGLHIDAFVLTSKAIDSVENSKSEKNKDAFIAIKFDTNNERIEAIHKAITAAGFNPVIMNQVETNNWIMPEIFDRIKKSRFVVADFSLSCDGAYYEAGYAAALEKPVIHLFDKREESEKNKLHFDIAQKSTIFYLDYKDLFERLLNRIKATIK